MRTSAASEYPIFGDPKSIEGLKTFESGKLNSSKTGKAPIAASQLAEENVADGDSTMAWASPDDGGGCSRGMSAATSCSTGFPSTFSLPGHIPSCSYRSKKDELVGGDFRLMLVERDLGNSLGVVDIGGVLISWVETKLGRGGRGLVGGGVSGDAEPEESLGKGMLILKIELVFDLAPLLLGVDDRLDMLVGVGKYGG